MTLEPEQPTPAPGGVDPLDATQPVDVTRYAPAPDPRPDTRWAWATPQPGAPGSWSGSPEAAQAASAYGVSQGADRWNAPASAATASFGSGAQTSLSVPVAPVMGRKPAVSPRGSGAGVGTVAAVALLAAVLASGSTVLALSATGTFDAAPAPPVNPGASQAAAPAGPAAVVAGDDSAAVINASSRVSPAVVKITVTGASSDQLNSGQTEGIGSGIIYDANGWILTNHHVVTGAATMTVELKDGRSFPGTVYGVDTLTDLAIVKVDATGLPAATMGSSDQLKVGQLVVAVGSPLGTYSFSVTSGVVSGKGRTVTVTDGSIIDNLIDTDAAINPGNSGGPLADAQGNVVGINTAVDAADGIGEAIPIDIAKPIMAQAVKGQKLQRPWIGVRYETIDGAVKAAQKLTVDNGALVINGTTSGGSAIQSGSPAETAGLKDGDIITAINDITLDQEHPLKLLLVQFAPGDTVQLSVLRAGQTLTVPLTLGVRPDNLQ